MSLPNHPDDVRQKIADLLRTQFGEVALVPPYPIDGPGIHRGGGEGGDVVTDTAEPRRREAIPISFRYLPRDIKAHLDRFVIRQDAAKKVLAIAVCDHYNHVTALANEDAPAPAKSSHGGAASERHRSGHVSGAAAREYAKQNVILIGPTGVGKTYVVKHIAELIGVPFVKADATKFSETGYVGGDVEDLVRDLVKRANGDVNLAQYGIIYIDEIDKIASQTSPRGRDVSGRGVQTTLLKLMEETEVSIRSQNDLSSQIAAALDGARGGKRIAETINTRNILFIVSGAFEGLKNIVARRIRQRQIGFSQANAAGEAGEIQRTSVGSRNSPLHSESSDLLGHVTTGDLIEFGLEPEFVGRLPVRVALEELNSDDLYQVLKRSEGSIVHQYERAFRAYGIEVLFEDTALAEIARLASVEQTGARGLLTVCERIVRDFKFELPGSGVTQLTITPELIGNPRAALQQLLDAGHDQRARALAAVARDFAGRMAEHVGFPVAFDEEAIADLVEIAQTSNQHMRDLCHGLFKDYDFGLRLAYSAGNRGPFTIGRDAVSDPDGYLSRWLVRTYRERRETGPTEWTTVPAP